MLEYLLTGSLTSTCLVGLVVGLIVYWLIQKWRYNYPPGPPGIPLLGNALQIDQSKLHEQVFKWSKKYGPVITLGIGLKPFVFVNTIDSALEVLVKKSTDFAGRMCTAFLHVLTHGGKDIALSSYGPVWKMQRRVASKALRHYMQGDSLQNRVHEAVEEALVEIDKVSGEFDPTEYLNFIVSNILTGLCYGEMYGFNDKEIQYILEKEEETFEQFVLGTWEDFIPGLKCIYKTEGMKAAEKLTTEIFDNFLNKKFKEAEKTFDKDNIRHITDMLLLARKEAEEEGEEINLSEEHIIQTISDILFAAIDRSRFTLRNVLLHMVAFPDIQEKVQEEIDRVVGKDRLPGLSDRPDLGCTEAVLHESMRLVTVAPLGLQHTTTCDTDICGYRIPKDTVVTINHWALLNDPDAWEEVNRFIPERYLDENGKLGPKPKNWLPFSAGRRVCLGEFVVKPELHLIFACLMQRYKWKMVSGKCPDITPAGGANALYCKPYKVIVERRC